MADNPEGMKVWVESLPPAAYLVVLASWQLGAFIGGAVCAYRRPIAFDPAGVIGCVVLLGTIINCLDMKQRYGFTHPDWMIVAGLLLPLPVSLLAGKMVATLYPPPPTVPAS